MDCWFLNYFHRLIIYILNEKNNIFLEKSLQNVSICTLSKALLDKNANNNTQTRLDVEQNKKDRSPVLKGRSVLLIQF